MKKFVPVLGFVYLFIAPTCSDERLYGSVAYSKENMKLLMYTYLNYLFFCLLHVNHYYSSVMTKVFDKAPLGRFNTLCLLCLKS